MDESYLCRDVLGLVFSFLPGDYANLVRVCRGVKGLLRELGIDGWDALVAHGIGVDITSEEIVWYKNRIPHRDFDLPAVIGDGYLEWYKDGVRHRIGKPAVISRTQFDCFDSYYVNGLMHRDNMPAHISLDDWQLWWYKNGEVHRDGGPAVVEPGYFVGYYQDGEFHRDDGPAYIDRDGDFEDMRWYKESFLNRDSGLPVAYLNDENGLMGAFCLDGVKADNPWGDECRVEPLIEAPLEYIKFIEELNISYNIEEYLVGVGLEFEDLITAVPLSELNA